MVEYVMDLLPQSDEYIPAYWESDWDSYECEIWDAPEYD